MMYMIAPAIIIRPATTNLMIMNFLCIGEERYTMRKEYYFYISK